MSSCCCSLAGTAACRHCKNNPFADDYEVHKPVIYSTSTNLLPLILTKSQLGELINRLIDERMKKED